jgi:selenide,water dikinase
VFGRSPNLQDLLLVGGGHAHLGVLMAFAREPEPGLRLTLVARELHAPYSGMLHGLVRGSFGWDDVHIDLGPLAAAAGVRLVHDSVVRLDAAAGHAYLASGRRIGFDLVSVDCGIVPDTRALQRGAGQVVCVKPIDGFLARWRQLQERLRTRRAASLAVVGGGAAGVELAFAVADRLSAPPGTISVVDAAPVPLAAANTAAQRVAAARLAARGIAFHGSRHIVAYDDASLLAVDGWRLAADAVLWAGSARPPDWVRESGLGVDADGYLAVAPTLRSLRDGNVFGAGDVVSVDGAPRPRAGVYAVRQGAPLAANLRAAARGQALRPYHAQRHALALIALAADDALAVRGHWAASGRHWMRLKRRIDERFVARHRDWQRGMRRARGSPRLRVQPRAAAAVTPDVACGGCGAKLPADVLRRTLATLPEQARHGVLAGLEAADDAAVLAASPLPLAVTVDGFRAPVSDVAAFARLALNHALSDAYAMAAQPSGVLALVTVEHGDERLKERDLEQVLHGTVDVLGPLGVPLLGGHSAEGAELGLGFTVLARMPGRRWFTKGGLRPGQVLVLTRPLGSGVLLAAAMRGEARSRWLAQALATMSQSLAAAAAVLGAAGAAGVTDVTGFGLLGHVAELARASRACVDVDAGAVPAYDGALDCLARGVASQLEPANARVFADFATGGWRLEDPRIRLLVDPQTCGGLVAGVDVARAGETLAALRAAGCAGAAVIGRVLPRASGGPLGTLLRGDAAVPA